MNDDFFEMHAVTPTHKKSVTWESDLVLETPPAVQPSTSLSQLTDNIVREIEDIVSGHTGITRKQSLVFQIVCGGNVEVVRNVFKRIKDDGNKQALDWMIGASPKTKLNIEREIVKSNSQWNKVLLFSLVVFLFILTTPVFYILHAFTVQMCLVYRRRITKHMQLPLVYALISEDLEMVKLFLENGCRISSIDSTGNNVYHYIADLSLDDPDKAFRCHEIIISLVKNINKLKHVITRHENNRRLTAWESMAKHGSLYLFRYIAMDQCGIGSRILSVSQEILWAKLPAEDWTQVDEQLSPGTGTDLDTKTFVQEEHEHPAIIDVWEFDLHRYNNGDVFARHSYPLHLLTSRTVEHLTKMDAASLLTFTLLWDWMRRKIRLYLLPCVLSHILNLLLIVSLLIFTVKHGGDMHTSPLAAPAYRKHMTDMYRVSEMINKQNVIPPRNNCSIREFAATTLNITSCVLQRTKETTTVFKFGVRGKIDGCMEDVINDMHARCKSLKLDDIVLAIFEKQTVSSTPIMDANIRTYIYLFIGASLVLDIMARIVFLSSNFHWKASCSIDMVWPVLSRTIPGSYVEKQLGNSMFTFYLAAILVGYKRKRSIAVIERGYHLYNSILFQDDSYKSRVDLFSVAADIKANGEISDSLEQVWGNLVILCLLLRFIQLIYSLRLLPGIGFFIITAKKMAKHLAQFAAIFIIVSLAFATIFYLVMKNPKCPAMKLDNFRSLLSSLFTIYQVFLGYGDHDFSANVNARLAYIAYTVTTVLLLLNLVIAVMTTTVEELNRTPWKQVMCLFEVWDEILGNEALVLTMVLPIKLLMRKAKKLLQITEDATERTRYEIVCWSRFEGAHTTL